MLKISRLVAAALAASLSGIVACGDQGGGCGDSYAAKQPEAPAIRCGPGTIESNGRCVATTPVK